MRERERVGGDRLTSSGFRSSFKETVARGAAKLNINILCEWKRCRHESINLREFRLHVDDHIANITPQETYDCHWDLCNYKCNDKTEMIIHIGFHVYHTNLKNIGECYLQSKDNLPPCVLDSRCRNLIPDENMSHECKWEDCDQTFLKINDFMDHVRDHGTHEARFRKQNAKNAMMCRWAGCGKSFTVIAIFADHRRTHTKEKQCGCPNCGTLFRNFSKFYDHFRRQATNSKFLIQLSTRAECHQLHLLNLQTNSNAANVSNTFSPWNCCEIISTCMSIDTNAQCVI